MAAREIQELRHITRTAVVFFAAMILAISAASAATSSNQLGGPNGAGFTDACPPGMILGAIGYNAGKDLDGIQGLCNDLGGDQIGAGYPARLKVWGNLAAGEDFIGNENNAVDIVQCPRGYGVRAIYVSVSKVNLVHSFYLQCWKPSTGKLSNTSMSSNKGGEGYPPQATGCGDGFYASGLTGGAGSMINRLGVLCEPIPVAAPQPPPVKPSAPGKAVMLESTNFPGMFVRHQNWQGLLTKLSSDLDYKDATFTLDSGLSGGRTVSLQSAEYPGYYLRHKNFVVVLEKNDGSQQFAKDGSFSMIKVTGSGTRFTSVNFPDMSIRHKDFKLVLNKSDGSTLFGKDSTFKIVAPQAPPPPVNVDNGDNGDTNNADDGDNGGGATAATDTTIYDQPAGNDVAYLNAGDAVTIVSCNDDNWCQISKPRRGWIWGDDLNR